MILTKIRMKNFKGFSGDIPLAPLTMIVGPNYSGKSRIIEAVTVALRGSLPSLGKTNPDTFKLAAADVMALLVEIDGQMGVRREWRRTKTRSIRATSQHGVPIKFDELPILDPSAYFNLSPAKRTAYLFAMTAAGGDTSEIEEIVNEVEIDDPDFSNDDQEALAVMRDIMHEHTRNSAPNEAVVEIVERLKEEFTEWNRRKNDAQGSSTKINELMQRQPARAMEYDALLDELSENRAKQKELSMLIGKALDGFQAVDDPRRKALSELENRELTFAELRERLAGKNRDLKKVEQTECCPYCLSDQHGWRERLLSEIRKQAKELQIEILAQEERVNAAKLECDNISKKYEQDVAELKEAKEKATASLYAELETAEATAEDVQRMIKDIDAWRSECALLKKSVADLRKAEAFVKIIKACQARMDKLKAKWVDSVFVDFMDRANRLGGDLLDAPLQFVDGEIGMFEGTQFVSFETFSGSERALCFATIAAALANQFPLRLLLLDEMGTMTGKTQSRVAHRLKECVEAGELDQVICVIPRDTPINLPGWHIINTAA